jgi:hypothetical protein
MGKEGQRWLQLDNIWDQQGTEVKRGSAGNWSEKRISDDCDLTTNGVIQEANQSKNGSAGNWFSHKNSQKIPKKFPKF